MPATVTLATTTLTDAIGVLARQVRLSSTAGIIPDLRLWIDRELMRVVSLGIDPWVHVIRGVDGTATAAHSSSSPVTIGRADQFYQQDPVGMPPAAIAVSPWINTQNGNVWFAQGDAQGSSRWWQLQTTSYDVGAFGVRTAVLNPTSST